MFYLVLSTLGYQALLVLTTLIGLPESHLVYLLIYDHLTEGIVVVILLCTNSDGPRSASPTGSGYGDRLLVGMDPPDGEA